MNPSGVTVEGINIENTHHVFAIDSWNVPKVDVHLNLGAIGAFWPDTFVIPLEKFVDYLSFVSEIISSFSFAQVVTDLLWTCRDLLVVYCIDMVGN